MGKRKRHETYTIFQPVTLTIPQPVIPVQQPTTFSPPIAMQHSVCASIMKGNFVDAKIFAFSRRSLKPGRVDTPKALFVDTHVLANACGYFRSLFDFPDGIEISLGAGLPSSVEPFFEMAEYDLDSDYDGPFEVNSAGIRPPVHATASIPPERTVKAYVVKYTAYRTLRAIIWYIYTKEITFSPSSSPGSPSASAKSVYRFADEHRMSDLKQLAFDKIATTIDSLAPEKLVEEAFSVFISRYPELYGLCIKRLRSGLSSFGQKDAFQQQLSRYFSGEIPHSKEILASLLQALMDKPAITSNFRYELGGGYNTITRVSRPWPARTKKALQMSLDEGIFEDIHVVALPGSESTEHLLHFAGVVDEAVGSSISRLCCPETPRQDKTDASVSTWQAIAYYMYTDCINFEPLGSQDAKLVPAHNPSDALFRGYPCSPREVLRLARKLDACDALIDLVITEIVSHMTLENVVDEMFCNPAPPARVVSRGVEIIRANRSNSHIRSQMQKVLEEAAAGESAANLAAFSACFDALSSGFGLYIWGGPA